MKFLAMLLVVVSNVQSGQFQVAETSAIPKLRPMPPISDEEIRKSIKIPREDNGVRVRLENVEKHFDVACEGVNDIKIVNDAHEAGLMALKIECGEISLEEFSRMTDAMKGRNKFLFEVWGLLSKSGDIKSYLGAKNIEFMSSLSLANENSVDWNTAKHMLRIYENLKEKSVAIEALRLKNDDAKIRQLQKELAYDRLNGPYY